MILLLAAAQGFTGDEVVGRVSETRPLRAKSLMAAEMPTIPDDAYRSAAQGETETGLVDVEGYKAKKAWGVAIVETPIEKYYAAVNDDASKPRYGRLSYTEVLSGGLCGEDRVVFMYLPVSLMTDRYWVSNVRKNQALLAASNGEVREMTWATREPEIPAGKRANDYTQKGMPIEFAKGAWYLTKLDASHTLVEYWTWTDPGGYVPAGLASSFAAGGIKDTIESMSKLAEDGPRCALE
ncbi:MAG: hypothetical protein R3F61_15780 [Myxococcota bacterium]